ncbi:RNA polymerase factor sigma-54 [Planctomycetota bacterium]
MARMELGQHLRASQEMQMQITPQQIMAANLLQLQQMSLEAQLNQEIETNPALELVEEKKEPEDLEEPEAEAEEETSEVDYYRDFNDDLDRRYVANDAQNDKQHIIEMTHHRQETLKEYLQSQLWELNLAGTDAEIAELILINLAPDGFLMLAEDGEPLIFKHDRYDLEEVELVLNRIRQLDPPGIAARNHQESLLLQLSRLAGRFPVAERILTDHYDDLLSNRIPRIASELGISIEGVKQAIDVIRRNLTPNPAGDFAAEESRYVAPDVIIEKTDAGFEIRLNNYFGNSVQISPEFKKKLKDSLGQQREYMRGKIADATMIIRAIEQRQETLLRIASALVERQRDWFEGRREVPQGMTRYDIAEDIDMHHSTVSRGVMNKYVQTARGIFPLKYFFGGSLDIKRQSYDPSGADSDSEKSVKEVKRLLRKIVDEENGKKPLSDSKIRQLITERMGVRIARRTVAKYRESLGILSSSKRKEY